MATTKTAKQVQVLCRYAHKTNGELNGIVTYCVKSSNNKDFYYTTLVNGKASGCSCPSRKPCYHLTQLEDAEWSRYRAGVARKLVAQNLTVEMVEQIVEQQQVEIVAQPVAPKRATYWDDNRACICYCDTHKPTGSLEGIDFGDTPMRWNAKEECFEEDNYMMKATLNGQRGFSILKSAS